MGLNVKSRVQKSFSSPTSMAFPSVGSTDLTKGLFDEATGVEDIKKAAELARQLGEKNAALIEQESAEQIRRTSKEQEYTESLALARAAASGVQISGSVDEYLSAMMKEHKAEIDWMKKSAKSRADIARTEGEYQFEMTRAQARQARAGYASTLASIFA